MLDCGVALLVSTAQTEQLKIDEGFSPALAARVDVVNFEFLVGRNSNSALKAMSAIESANCFPHVAPNPLPFAGKWVVMNRLFDSEAFGKNFLKNSDR